MLVAMAINRMVPSLVKSNLRLDSSRRDSNIMFTPSHASNPKAIQWS